MSTRDTVDSGRSEDRRQDDRRKAQVPYLVPDRRKADRRTGAERRKRDRSATTDNHAS